MRPLFAHEFSLARWMLEHGDPAGVSFLNQLAGVRVVAQCACGCGSLDFAVDGLDPPEGGVRILGDYVVGEERYGAFIFERGGVLAGIELYGMAVDPPGTLPDPTWLRAWSDQA